MRVAGLSCITYFLARPYGTDQLIAQRMFCCRGPREARWAIVSSYAGLLVTVTVMMVGAGLFAYYQAHPLTGPALQLYKEDGNRIFPLFIIEVLPPGLTGLLIAAVFAAAISSMDSILAALSQTVLSAFYLPWRRRRRQADEVPDNFSDRHALIASRVMVVLWGIALCLLAQLAAVASTHYESVLDLGLAMAGYAGGALVAAFLLAFLPLSVDGRGLCWSAPISLATVFAAVWHQPWAQWSCLVFAGAVLTLWMFVEWPRADHHRARRTGWLVLAIALMLAASRLAYVAGPPDPVGNAIYLTVAWPWQTPIGCTMAFVFGYLLARPREQVAR